jgi:hypothetical protein
MKKTLGSFDLVNPMGWTVLLLGLVAALIAVGTGWVELAVLAAACLLLLVFALPFLWGRTRVRVDLMLDPPRVVAGDSVVVTFSVTNLSAGRMLPTTLELTVGAAVHRYSVPFLGSGARHEESFTLRTNRRGVIHVGPAATRRGDPLGLFSKDTQWTEVHELMVRPPIVALESLGAGLLRDLEGVSTDAVSQSDLAFHALREYVPGDDLRHVHWRSSAKAMGLAAESQLLVRQYLDTQRSHVTVVVDDNADAWAAPEDFETAMSVAASLVVRATLDDFDASFVCGSQVYIGRDPHLALDSICRAEDGRIGLLASAQQAAQIAAETSLLFLISGPATEFDSFLRSVAVFPSGVRRIAIIVDSAGSSRVAEVAHLPCLRLAKKVDLAPLLRWITR